VLGSVYSKYFLDNKVVIEEKKEIMTTDKNESLNEKKENKIQYNKTDNISLAENNKNKVESKKKIEISENAVENDSKITNENKEKLNKQKKEQVKNLVKDVEYLTTDKKGNRYKILATSGRTNLDDNNVLDLDNVRGVITSEKRPPIYIVSDFAEYNSSNLDSKFYQNVVINYLDKQINCDNFDINMETNIAIAYNNVIVTDPQSKMTAGKIILDIETKDIIINPENDKSKVKVITN
tara:strand:+ start:101 stop:811 length:711 start_codon:yes stop_codon:yes gene_type:complete